MVGTAELDVARYAARISLWALGVAGGSLLVATSLFALEVRRWFSEGVRLSMSIMVDAKRVAGPTKDPNTYLAITVSNRGSSPTTITHMVLYIFPNRLSRWLPRYPKWLFRLFKKHWPETRIIPEPGNQPLPYVLEPGHRWLGMAIQTSELDNSIDTKCVCVGVIGSHSDKPFLKIVRRWNSAKRVS